MNTNQIQPIKGAGATNNLPDSKAQSRKDEQQASTQSSMPLQEQIDAVKLIFTIGSQEGEEETPRQKVYREIEEILTLMEQSNRRMLEEMAKVRTKKPQNCAVPSTLGMSVHSAAGKLKNNNLKLGAVQQKYSDTVPAGYVIAQIPGPGGAASQKSSVSLIISKGKPPEKEKYDTLRKKENVAVLRIKNKQELEEEPGGTLDMEGGIII